MQEGQKVSHIFNKIKSQGIDISQATFYRYMREFSQRRNPMQIEIPNFKESEFWCHCSKKCKGKIHPRLLFTLQALRYLCKKPIIITSGYRCIEHNRKVGGAESSQHLIGEAVDVTIDENLFLVRHIAQSFDIKSYIYDRHIHLYVPTRCGVIAGKQIKEKEKDIINQGEGSVFNTGEVTGTIITNV